MAPFGDPRREHKFRLRPAPPPSLFNKIGRVAWRIVWSTLYRPSPIVCHGWRRMLLRAFQAQVGRNAHPYPSVRIWAPWNLAMGPRSCLAAGVDCYNVGRVVLGADAIVSQRAYLCTATHAVHDPAFTLLLGDIHLEDGAWVAAEAFVGPGLTIGAGAVVGARAVAMRDVEPGAVVAGNPARKVGDRRG